MVELNKVIVGDALTVLRQLPDDFVDVTVTSPPYNKGERDKGWLVDKVVYEVFVIAKTRLNIKPSRLPFSTNFIG